MARTPKPWYRKDRKSWFVTVHGQRHNLGPERKAAFLLFHELMANSESVSQKPVKAESVASIIDAYLEWCLKHRAKRTYDWYLERCQWFIDTIPDGLSVKQLKPYHIQQWVDAHPNWSDGHIRGCIIAIQRPMRWAEKMGLIEQNPIAHVEKPQQGSRDLLITQEIFDVILSRATDLFFQDLLVTAWETGARPQEILAVEARHVDVKNSRWVFPKEEAKGKRQIRVVYLSDRALEITERILNSNPEGPIFRNKDGNPWTPYSVNCRFFRLKKKLGTKYCLYLFRHSFATRMLESGLDPITVSVLMGHKDTTMLARVYQHLSHNPDNLLQQIRKAAG